jgi:hypothetical protein
MTVRKKELPNRRKKVPLDEKKNGCTKRERERWGPVLPLLSPPKSRRSFKVTHTDKECYHQVRRVRRRSWISASRRGAPTLRQVNTRAKLGTTESARQSLTIKSGRARGVSVEAGTK